MLGVAIAFLGMNCKDCSEDQQKFRGCKDTPLNGGFIFEGEELDRCPVNKVTSYTNFQLRLYSHYRKGFLLCKGGIIDQPSKYLEAMETIAASVSDHEEAELEKRKKEQ